MAHLFTLNKYFRKYRGHFLLGILFVLLTNYFRILSPQLTGYVVNSVTENISAGGAAADVAETAGYDIIVQKVIESFNHRSLKNRILFAGLVLLVLAILSGVFLFLMRQTIIVMSRLIEYDQKNEIYAHYQKLDTAFYKIHSTGDMMNRISEDVSRVRMYTGPAIMYFINLAAIMGFSIFFMLRADVRLTMFALLPLPILALVIFRVNTTINRKSERIQAMLSDLTGAAQESYSGIRVIKSFVQEGSVFNFFKGKSNEYRKHALSLAKTEAIWFPSIGLLIGISTGITILAGALDVVNRVPGASVGKIAEFVMYIQMFSFPVSALGWTASMIQRAAASQKRINEFLLTDPAVKSKPNANKKLLGGAIEFKNVSFTYPHTGIEALRNFNLNIKAGERIAIIGRTGAGKSTVAQLLLRGYDAGTGSVNVDGVPITDLDLEFYRSQVAFVPQDIFLFSDSVANNIAFGNNSISRDAVESAAESAAIAEEIRGFPAGFDTIVGERGVTLSGGQKQRISIARALAKESKILILDDCLSAVDTNTEQRINAGLERMTRGKTLIMITHRIFSSMNFDRIIVIEDGTIAEEGNHTELLAHNRIYKKMFERQQEAERQQ